jgi:hypothetical protein
MLRAQGLGLRAQGKNLVVNSQYVKETLFCSFSPENATASADHAATRLELVDKSCCGVSERTSVK